MWKITVLCGLFFLSMAELAEADFLYRVTSIDRLGASSSVANAINDLGHVTGHRIYADGEMRGFYFDGNSTIDLGMTNSTGLDINNNNHIVGHAGIGQAFRYTQATGGVLLDPANLGSANGINDGDVVIGERNLGPVDRVILSDASNTTTIQYPALNARGLAINNNGEWVGTVNNNAAAFYTAGAPSVRQGIPILPTDINDQRLITGVYGAQAAVYNRDTTALLLLGHLENSHTFSSALAINEDGTVVGYSDNSAFIYDSTFGLRHLSLLLEPGSMGWHIQRATDINNHGSISGICIYNGEQYAVVLNVVATPEPSTVILFTCLCSVCVLRLRTNFTRKMRAGLGKALSR